MRETKFGSYMFVHFNAISWHLLEQCVVLPVGNALGTKWDFGDLFDSEPAVSV